MKKLCVINVVGLTPRLLAAAPRIAAVGRSSPWRGVFPAVTSTAQATMLTGRSPAEHGIVGNGWFYRDTQEIRFWQQARTLIDGPTLPERYETAQMFWWFNQASSARYGVTPKPHYGADGSKAFGVIDWTGCNVESVHGPFPFAAFWGPRAGLASSEWIAAATATVIRKKSPQLTLCYLPHLDYDFQRFRHHDPGRVAEVDRAAGVVIDAAGAVGADVVVVSEYGLTPVSRHVSINQIFRRVGLLSVRDGPFGEQLMPSQSEAFAVVDHQIAHVHIRQADMIDEVSGLLTGIAGIDQIDRPGAFGLGHRRAGELVVTSEPDAWFDYRYWLDERRRPDFAPTVDIHRKPGYDPCELFLTSAPRAAARLLQKKLGFRYRMDVVPTDPSLVGGSHGLLPSDPADGPLIVGDGDLPNEMMGFAQYVDSRLRIGSG